MQNYLHFPVEWPPLAKKCRQNSQKGCNIIVSCAPWLHVLECLSIILCVIQFCINLTSDFSSGTMKCLHAINCYCLCLKVTFIALKMEFDSSSKILAYSRSDNHSLVDLIVTIVRPYLACNAP